MANTDHDSRTDSPSPDGTMKEQTLQEFQDLIAVFTEAKHKGQTKEAEQAAMQALMLAAAEAEYNPDPDTLLCEEASKCEQAGDWTGAESARRKVLILREAEGNLATLAEGHRRLGQLLQFVGRLEDARESAQKATAAARQAGLEALLAMALNTEANCALLQEKVAEALSLVNEAVQQIGADPMAQTLRSTLHVTRARCLVAKHNFDGAEQDLAACRVLLGDKPMFAWAGGISRVLAECWEVDAVVHATHGDFAGAVECGRKAVGLRREVAQLPHLQGPEPSAALARSLEACAKNFRQAGQVAAAEEQEKEARQIRLDLKLPKTA